MMIRKTLLSSLVVTAGLVLGTSAWAGPVIIDGTDANDHGSASVMDNFAGWLYMQKALENVAAGMTGTFSKTVRAVGLDSSSTAEAVAAIKSAFSKSSLVGDGWSLVFDDTDAGVESAITSLSTSTTGILYIPTVAPDGGDMSTTELAKINANATDVKDFVNSGGGLFAMGENAGTASFGWLITLIPTITIGTIGGGGVSSNIELTTEGASAFPGLTNADLASADPWHSYFGGTFGSLDVLGIACSTSTSSVPSTSSCLSRNVIIGGGSGTIIAASKPGTMALFGLGLAGLGFLRRRRAA